MGQIPLGRVYMFYLQWLINTYMYSAYFICSQGREKVKDLGWPLTITMTNKVVIHKDMMTTIHTIVMIVHKRYITLGAHIPPEWAPFAQCSNNFFSVDPFTFLMYIPFYSFNNYVCCEFFQPKHFSDAACKSLILIISLIIISQQTLM